RPETPSAALDPQLVALFGSGEALENYTRSVLDMNDDLLEHLYALTTLARRYPPDREIALSPDSKARLNAIAQDHGREIRRLTTDLEQQLERLMNNLGHGHDPAPGPPASTTWQASATSALAAAQNLDRVLRPV